MRSTDDATMKAVTIDAFGGIDRLILCDVPRPVPGADQVLIRVEAAGVGSWDAQEREGEYDGLFGLPSRFPYILGWEGSGTVVDVGANVATFSPGDRVIAASMPLPNGGFYAEYAVADATFVAPFPETLSTEQAAALPWDGLTAQSGLKALSLAPGQWIMIIGASGGIGHLAVQLSKIAGYKVLAVASGADGVQLASDLGADIAIDGRREDIIEAVSRLVPDELKGILTLVGGDAMDDILTPFAGKVPIAAPHGIAPLLQVERLAALTQYNGDREPEAFARLLSHTTLGSFTVHIDSIYKLADASQAHARLKTHYIGKLALRTAV